MFPRRKFDRSFAGKISRAELWTATGIFLLVLVLRIVYTAHYRIDSDEPQHLHVVWGWTQGMIPYRDYFDNHSPLFHLLCAPLFALLGVRPDIVIPMRCAMIPLFALSVFFVGRIAATLYSARVGLWAAVFAAVCPRFFFVSTEFRPDDLWALLWFATLFTTVAGRMTLLRNFLVGFLLGAAFCVSIKTILMLVSMILATVVLLALRIRAGKPVPLATLIRVGLPIAAGILALPLIVFLFFAVQGSIDQLFYCLITHNVPPASHVRLLRALKWFGLLIISLALGIFLFGRSVGEAKKRTALWIFFVTVFYYVTLKSFSPILNNEDYLPSDPLFMMLLAVGIFSLPWSTAGALGRNSWGIPICLGFVGLAYIVVSEPPFRDETADKISMVETALRLTTRSEYVMDSKGETIYRRRPFYYILEGMTGMRIKAGLIKDTIAEQLIATETRLVTVLRMPAKAAAFIQKNYVPIAFRLSVLGQMLWQRGNDFPLDIVVPGEYTFVSECGAFAGMLNGKPVSGAIRLEPGHYEMSRTNGSGRLAVVWARAVEKGYTPFVPLKEDRWTAQD